MAYIAIYDTTPLDEEQLTRYLQPTDHHWEYIPDAISVDNLHPDSEVLSVFVTSTVTREMIERLPRLKLIACRSTGFNNVDRAAAAEHGVVVANVPTYGENTVAEYTFTLMLALSRKLLASVNSVKEASFSQVELMGTDLVGKTLGVVGLGRIGQHVATIGRAFGMRLVAFDPFPNEDKAKELGVSYVTLDELAEQSDVITIHSPYTGDNHHLINADFLAKAKPSAILINTARGELLDTQALIDALHEHRLGGAALDVLEGEQLLKIDEELLMLRDGQHTEQLFKAGMQIDILKRFPNVIVSPHNAFNTREALDRINHTTADNMIRFWYGEVPNKVIPPKPKSGQLIIVRHGESEWNALGKWTGSRDVHLSEKGFHEAALLGQAMKDVKLDYAFCSQQVRAFETLNGIVDSIQQIDVPYERSDAINERDYGDYTGLNKWEVQKEVGEETFQRIRRDWDYPVPNGETLKMVYDRVLPFYKDKILPKVLAGQTVLMVSHGNAIRALIKYLEHIPEEKIGGVEMPFGNILIYEVDQEGYMTKKSERKIETIAPPA